MRLLCSSFGVRLLSGAVSSRTEEDVPMPLLTRPQASALAKTLRQSGALLQQRQLPLVDFHSSNGFFLKIEC